MAHDSTVDDTDEPHTDSRLRTDGGSEAETVDESEQQESTEESDESEQQESTEEREKSEQQESTEENEKSEQQESTEESDKSEQQESTEESDKSEQQESTEERDESEQQETADEPEPIEADDEAVAEQTGDVGVEPQQGEESDTEASEQEADESDESTPSLDGEGDTASIIEIRNQVIELSTDVIGRGLDGIIEVTRNDEHWRAVVEIIERRSVPDTQDILGQYEIELDDSGEVVGYRRLEKYRRSDTGPAE